MKNENQLALVYMPVRYGQVIGVYADESDAFQVVRTSIAKGQLCDLVIKPIIYPLKSN